ncbi:hypothetical protein KK2020170_05410 [Flavobacterium okayamense]|uniref:Lipoprotein n=2 Tax=Flavobacterium okayamense TaxID=2830782 RepID=A0ABM7S256_9FLAO|nr:hypothetical protein KK2020170_05410 [Flavobacterium okayamense]
MILFFSCNRNFVKNSNQDDYLIANDILKNRVFKKMKELNLYSKNNNEYVISVFEKLNDFSKNENTIKSDSIKAVIGVQNVKDSIIEKIFNAKDYKFLISQKSNSKWINKYINTEKIKTSDILKNSIYISKPIYTKDKEIAIIQTETSTQSSILIYINKNNTWHFYKLISPRFKQPKAEYIKNKIN